MASKMRLVRVLLLAVTSTWSFCLLRAQESAPRLDDPAIEQRVSALLGQMTLEEKIGQLVRSSAGGANDGAAQTNALQKLAVEQSRLHIPVLFGLDVIHGYRTVFPVPLAMASTWDPSLVERASRIAAKEATSEGIRSTYSPMVDIARDARWGRIVEGAGEDPYLGSAMAAAYVRGYQGARLDDSQSMLACMKHFVGYGAAEGGRDYNSVDMSERMLRQIYLPPFHAAVKAGVGSVMSAFNSLNGVPATSDWFTLTHILRQEWGFQGVVISDYGSVRETIAHGIAVDGPMAASKALLAGLDMDLEGNEYSPYLAELVRSGAVPEAAVDQAVRRVLRIKFALGLFDHPYTPEPASGGKPQLDPADVEFARTVAERSFVLLKNDNAGEKAPLPFGPEVRTIALIGPLADSASDMLGPWHARGDAADVVTLRTALVSRMQQSGEQVLFAEGTEILTAADNGFAAAVTAAKQADVVLMARFPSPSRFSRKSAAALAGNSGDGKTDRVDRFQRPATDPRLGRGSRTRDFAGVVPGSTSGAGAGANPFRRCESQREAHCYYAPQRGPGTALL